MSRPSRSRLLPSILAATPLALAIWQPPALAQSSPYAAMAPVAQYLMPEDAEISLARSAAPPAISAGAEVMVLGRTGYTTAAKGGNGFVCLVQRSWGAATDDPVFWNFKVRGPICFNPAAARSVLPVYLMKTRLLLAGKSKQEMVRALAVAFDSKELPPLAPGAMSYMLAKRQYLGDQPRHWHPHLMLFVPPEAAQSWGADLPGSPVMEAKDPEERMTIVMVVVGNWSDGSPAPRPMR